MSILTGPSSTPVQRRIQGWAQVGGLLHATTPPVSAPSSPVSDPLPPVSDPLPPVSAPLIFWSPPLPPVGPLSRPPCLRRPPLLKVGIRFWRVGQPLPNNNSPLLFPGIILMVFRMGIGKQEIEETGYWSGEYIRNKDWKCWWKYKSIVELDIEDAQWKESQKFCVNVVNRFF